MLGIEVIDHHLIAIYPYRFRRFRKNVVEQYQVEFIHQELGIAELLRVDQSSRTVMREDEPILFLDLVVIDVLRVFEIIANDL